MKNKELGASIHGLWHTVVTGKVWLTDLFSANVLKTHITVSTCVLTFKAVKGQRSDPFPWKWARSLKTVTDEGTAAISMRLLISFCVVLAGPDPQAVFTQISSEKEKEGLEKAWAEREKKKTQHHYLEIHPPSIYLLWDVEHTTYSCRHMFTHTCTHTVNSARLQLRWFLRASSVYRNMRNCVCILHNE